MRSRQLAAPVSAFEVALIQSAQSAVVDAPGEGV